MPSLRSRIRGCLLGGAVGDALGQPVEFDSREDILARHGPDGPAQPGRITDDTQMTLFTAEGLIRARNRQVETGACDVPGVVLRAYQRWLLTQGERPAGVPEEALRDGWLIGVEALHRRRAPGGTCLSALRSGRRGSPEAPLNGSKGCGGAMRIAPAGLTGGDPEAAFRLGCELAALTHGHPTGWLAAGYLAALLARLLRGEPLRGAAEAALAHLDGDPRAAETRDAVRAALELSEARPGDPEALASLGGGWVAEEAVAIGLYAALSGGTFERALPLAVVHDGDSDSTGSIAGQILGAHLGEEAIPELWLEALELRHVVTTVADDLWRAFHGEGPYTATGAYAPDRYPGR